MAEKGKKPHHRCPPIPEGWDVKFTGPKYEASDSVGQAKRKWWDYVRQVQNLRPMPRHTR